jgi:hypothetical protein
MAKSTHSNEKIGLFSTLAIGIGGMVGGGIFAVQGEAILLAREVTPLAFLLAGLLALVTAYSYLKLTLHFHDNGGTAVFIRAAFGQNILTEAANLLLWVAYLVSIALYADAFGDHALALMGISQHSLLLKHGLTTIAILLPALLNLAGISVISRTENIAVIVKLGILLFIVISGLFTLNHLPDFSAPLRQAPLNTFTGVAAASAFIFIAFQGFELIANAATNTRHPRYTLPRAYFGAVIFTGLLYLLITLIVLSSVPLERVADIKETVLAEAALPILGSTGYTLISIAAMLSTLAAITVTLYGINRLGHELAREKELPAFMLAERGLGAFLLRLALFSGIAILLANTLQLNTIAVLASGLFILVFALVNAAALQLAEPLRANRRIPLFGLLSSCLALAALIIHTSLHQPQAALVLLNTILTALMLRTLYAIYTMKKHR